jgi:hypothetical protein
VLLAWGSADRTIPPAHHRDVARALPTAHSVELADVGHYPQETAPHLLLPALTTFLTDTSAVVYRESRWRDLLTGPDAPAYPRGDTDAPENAGDHVSARSTGPNTAPEPSSTQHR